MMDTGYTDDGWLAYQFTCNILVCLPTALWPHVGPGSAFRFCLRPLNWDWCFRRMYWDELRGSPRCSRIEGKNVVVWYYYVSYVRSHNKSYQYILLPLGDSTHTQFPTWYYRHNSILGRCFCTSTSSNKHKPFHILLHFFLVLGHCINTPVE